ncbi:MAG TPA: sulfite exporter TauE/SafE family protein [Steroidobacteraceae bacterium]
MDLTTLVTLALGFALVAALYSSVGHAGASGYLALMALAGLAPAVMRPTALVLNLVVALIGTYRFSRAGLTSWRALLPLVAASVPTAFLGGSIHLSLPGYRKLVGLVLLASAVVLGWRAWKNLNATQAAEPPIAIPVPMALGIGGAIGLLSGLTGTGGGIFLSPLLLLAGWAGPRRTAGLSAPFILLNSFAGLAGLGWSNASWPAELPWLVVAVLAGGVLGTRLGTQKLPARALVALLAVVLLVASLKLLATS